MNNDLKTAPQELLQNDGKQDNGEDIKRLYNIGKPVTLSFGEYRVREFGFFDILEILSDCIDAFTAISEMQDLSSQMNDTALFLKVIKTPDFRIQVAKLFAKTCQEPDYNKFMTMKVRDFTTLLPVVKEVIDFEELKSAFFQLGLQKYLIMPTSTV